MMSLTRNLRLTVAYDGTDFHGFAEAEGVPTVMGALRRAVETIVRGRVELTGAGRTDAGVHAWGQVVSGRLPIETDLGRLVAGVNGMCAPAIAVRDPEWVDDDFSARFSATARVYRYRVWNSSSPHPLLVRTSWHVSRALDVAAMNDAARDVIGEHDFSSFCRRPRPAVGQPAPSLVRRVTSARWSHVDDAWGPSLVEFEIAASSFCHQMVRSIVGTLVEVGLGRRDVASLGATLAARDRTAAGPVAPATGLVLHAVDYSGRRWDA